MDKQTGTSAIHVDLIRVVAIFSVLLFHAINGLLVQTVNDMGVLRWLIVIDIYQLIGKLGVPLFIMLSGALLLTPSKKDEDIGAFFKKRFNRIGLPFLFWGVFFFLWELYVENQPFTHEFIINGLLKGPYVIFWYLYMLVGLYLITPLLRVMIAHFTDKLFKYFLCLWFIGITIVSLIEFVSGWQLYLTGIVFLIPVCVGYYVIGVYLAKIHIRRWILVVLTVLGFVLTTIATYFADGYSSDVVFFFQGPGSPPMMLATLALFILLNSYAKPKTRSQMEKPSWIHRIMHVISENTLPIYLMHMVVVYLLKSGLFGFVLDSYAIDAIIGVPLIAVLTLMISLIIIIPLKKIPGIRKLIG